MHMLLSAVLGIILHAIIKIPVLYYVPFALLGGMLSIWRVRFLFVTIAMLSAANLQLSQSSEVSAVERKMTFSGVVVGETHYRNYTKLFIHIDHVLLDKGAVEHPLLVEYYAYERGIFLGKRLAVRGHIKPARSTYRMSVLTGEIISSSIPRQLFGAVFHPLRNYVDTLLRKMFRHDQYTIASGLILGGSGRMGEELKDLFGRAGVLHILAVSGLHVGFVALFLGLMLFIFPMDYRLKFIVVMLGLFVYAGVTGFRPSVCRAGSMALLFGLASVLQRNVNHIHVLNVTALAFLIVRPVLLFDIGTQLSFAAVYGILFMYPKLDAVIKKGIRMRVVRLVARPMAVSLSAQIFVAPLLIHYFHRLPVYAVLANLLVVPIAATIIFLLFVCFGTGLFWYGLVEYISLPVSCLINILVVVSGLFARLPFSTVKIMVSPLLVFPLYLMVGKKMRRFVPWVMIVVAGVFSIAGSCDCLVVYTVAKGMLIITPSRESVLICMQRTSAQQICLEKNGIDELDYLMAPSPCYPVKKAFIALPGRMCYKQYWLGDLEVRLSKNIVLRFRDTEVVCALADLQSARDGGEYTYWLSNGKQQCVLRGSLFCTILEQMIFDVQIVLAQLRMLM